jgi:hypothetical protein
MLFLNHQHRRHRRLKFQLGFRHHRHQQQLSIEQLE